MNRGRLTDSHVHAWHGLATFLTMMTVWRAPHRIAALHRLFWRSHAAAIGCVCTDSDGEHSQKSLSSKTHPE